MMTHRTLVLVAALLLSATGLHAQTHDELFDAQTVHDIRLFVNSTDVQRLEEFYEENTFYTADLQWRTTRVRNIGIRSRGSASRSATKPGLQIEFDRYVGGQQFLGLRSLVLDNLWQDPGMMREQVAMGLFARLGHAAPRESFARVFINDVYYGVYTVVEAITPEFLARTTGQASGYIYEFKYLGPYHFEFLGDDYAPYKSLFEPRAHDFEPDATLYGPIREMIREMNQPLDEVWRERVEKHVDLAQFVKYVAIEMFLAEDDGVLGSVGMSNFYLARGAADRPFQLIPWDKDLTFTDPRLSIFTRAEENILFQRAMEYGDLRALYLETLEAAARSALTDGWMAAEIDRCAALIAEHAAADIRKPYSTDDFNAAVSALKQFALERPGYVLQEVAKMR
jgi:spore coat protein CotH